MKKSSKKKNSGQKKDTKIKTGNIPTKYIILIALIVLVGATVLFVFIKHKYYTNSKISTVSVQANEPILKIPESMKFENVQAVENDDVVNIVKSISKINSDWYIANKNKLPPDQITKHSIEMHDDLSAKLKPYGIKLSPVHNKKEYYDLRINLSVINNYLIKKGWYFSESYTKINNDGSKSQNDFFLDIALSKIENKKSDVASRFDGKKILIQIYLISRRNNIIKNGLMAVPALTEFENNEIILDLSILKNLAVSKSDFFLDPRNFDSNQFIVSGPEWRKKYQRLSKDSSYQAYYADMIQNFIIHETQHIKDFEIRNLLYRGHFNLNNDELVGMYLEAHSMASVIAEGPIPLHGIDDVNSELKNTDSKNHHNGAVFIKSLMFDDQGFQFCDDVDKLTEDAKNKSKIVLSQMNDFYLEMLKYISIPNMYELAAKNKKYNNFLMESYIE